MKQSCWKAGNSIKAVLAFACALIPSLIFAGVPAPHCHISFDDGYGIEGKVRDVTPTVAYDSIPGDNIVPGLRGNGIIPFKSVGFKGRNLVPAPEGTF